MQKSELVKTLKEHPKTTRTSLDGNWIMEVYFTFRDNKTAIIAEKQPQPELNEGEKNARWSLSVSNPGLEQIFRKKRSLEVVGRESALQNMAEMLNQSLIYETTPGHCPDCQAYHEIRPDLSLVADHARQGKTPEVDIMRFMEDNPFRCGICVKKAKETLNKFEKQAGKIFMFGGWQ